MKLMKPKPVLGVLLIMVLLASVALGLVKYKGYADSSKVIQSKIDIGGYSLYVNCMGKGNPTVIFESGYSDYSGAWEKVQPEISKLTRTFSYDRAGLGRSDLSPLKGSTESEVFELHILLEKARVKGPYIIVAHSMGGFNARLYAATYPGEVAGIVFVDCTNEIFGEKLKTISAEEAEKLEINYKYIIVCSEQVKQARAKDVLRNTPIIVLSADQKGLELTEEGRKDLEWQQADIASLSDRSEHIFVKDSSHHIQKDQPQTVIAAIEKLIDIVRNDK